MISGICVGREYIGSGAAVGGSAFAVFRVAARGSETAIGNGGESEGEAVVEHGLSGSRSRLETR